jgi:hypothetical protein
MFCWASNCVKGQSEAWLIFKRSLLTRLNTFWIPLPTSCREKIVQLILFHWAHSDLLFNEYRKALSDDVWCIVVLRWPSLSPQVTGRPSLLRLQIFGHEGCPQSPLRLHDQIPRSLQMWLMCSRFGAANIWCRGVGGRSYQPHMTCSRPGSPFVWFAHGLEQRAIGNPWSRLWGQVWFSCEMGKAL